jgi:hypothetical protein
MQHMHIHICIILYIYRIFNNIWEKWSSVSRRHMAAKQSAAATFNASLSGYGGNKGGRLINTVLDELELKVLQSVLVFMYFNFVYCYIIYMHICYTLFFVILYMHMGFKSSC